MAHPAVRDPHGDLTGVGRLDVDVVDDQHGLAVVLEQGGTHGRSCPRRDGADAPSDPNLTRDQDATERDRQLIEAAEHDAAVPRRPSVASSMPGKRRDERADRDLALEPGEGGAEAVVDAAAEREVLAAPSGGAGRGVSASSPHSAGSRLAEPRQVITNVPGVDRRGRRPRYGAA